VSTVLIDRVDLRDPSASITDQSARTEYSLIRGARSGERRHGWRRVQPLFCLVPGVLSANTRISFRASIGASPLEAHSQSGHDIVNLKNLPW